MKNRMWAIPLCWLVLSQMLSAQPDWPEVRFTARPTLGEVTRFSRPTPITVDLQYSGTATLTGKASAGPDTSNNRITGEVALTLAPGPARQCILLYPSGTYGLNLKVEAGRQSTRPQALNVQGTPDNDTLALVLAPVGTEFAYLGGYKSLLGEGELRVNKPRPETLLPEFWSAYLGADLIVIQDLPKLNLSEAVEKAILDWTRAGGSLVLVSNLDPAEYQHSRFHEAAPLRLKDTANLDGMTLVKGDLQGGAESIFARQGKDLALQRKFGAGQIFQVAVNARDQDMLGTKLTEKLWGEILRRHKSSNFRVQRFVNQAVMTKPAELPIPSAAAMAYYLVAYVFVATPINYFWLRRRDRLLWMIITIPAVSLAFSAGAYFVNSAGRSSEVVLRQMGLCFLRGDSDVAVGDESVMLFSPASTTFQVKFPVSSYVRPTDLDNSNYYNKELHFGCDARHMFYRDFQMPMWSISRFRSTSLHKLAGPLTWSHQGSKLKIDNASGLTLEGCVLVKHNLVSQSFSLGPGKQTLECQVGSQSSELHLEASADKQLVTKEDVAVLLRELEAVVGANPGYLLGWSRDEALDSGLEVGRTASKHRISLVVVQ